jgi:hypothetical protein
VSVIALFSLGVLTPYRRVLVERRCDACGHCWSETRS